MNVKRMREMLAPFADELEVVVVATKLDEDHPVLRIDALRLVEVVSDEGPDGSTRTRVQDPNDELRSDASRDDVDYTAVALTVYR